MNHSASPPRSSSSWQLMPWILSLMVLGAGPGRHVLVRAEGSDEQEALAALEELIGGGFDEQP